MVKSVDTDTKVVKSCHHHHNGGRATHAVVRGGAAAGGDTRKGEEASARRATSFLSHSISLAARRLANALSRAFTAPRRRYRAPLMIRR